MKSTVLILLCLIHLFSLLVKETDCIGAYPYNGKGEKVMTIFFIVMIVRTLKQLSKIYFPLFSVHCLVFCLIGVFHQPKENVVVFKLQRNLS